MDFQIRLLRQIRIGEGDRVAFFAEEMGLHALVGVVVFAAVYIADQIDHEIKKVSIPLVLLKIIH